MGDGAGVQGGRHAGRAVLHSHFGGGGGAADLNCLPPGQTRVPDGDASTAPFDLARPAFREAVIAETQPATG